jgi:hypothetical protein
VYRFPEGRLPVSACAVGNKYDLFLREMIDRARRLYEEIKQAREEEQTNG